MTVKKLVDLMIDGLEPIDRTMDVFARGGVLVARKIVKIRDQLHEMKRLAANEACQAHSDNDDA